MSLATFQHVFWRSLWCPEPEGGPPWAAQPGFAVYRNTVLKGCVDNLLALHPAVRRLTGDDWLRAVALDYVRAHPPADGRMHVYGEHFADFIARALPPGELPWLHPVARLDRLWMESHVAADAPCLAPDALMQRPLDALGGTCLRIHPATRWFRCAAWPVFSLWQAAREAWPDPNPPHWRGEGALFTRPGGAVLATRLDAGACALLTACATGSPLPEALAAAQAHHPSPDLGATLGLLITQGAFSADLA